MKRPGFQKMIAAIEAGYISAVFVKDLSRLGRNYIEVGKLTEEFFPLHDVRLVAVSDGVDSDEGEDDFTPFKNIMNEYYAKDISKKRRIVNKMKGNAGIPLSPPPYTNAAKITKRMVGELIDHIDVYQAEKQDGVTTQRVVIHYNCIGAFDVPDRRKIPEADIIMETRKGVALSYAPAV